MLTAPPWLPQCAEGLSEWPAGPSQWPAGLSALPPFSAPLASPRSTNAIESSFRVSITSTVPPSHLHPLARQQWKAS